MEFNWIGLRAHEIKLNARDGDCIDVGVDDDDVGSVGVGRW